MAVKVDDRNMEAEVFKLFDPSQDTIDAQVIPTDKLDFSVGSLSHLETYLDHVRNQKHSGRPLLTMVLRSGGYVGEVIRRNASHGRWHWIKYDEATKLEPKVASLGKSIHSAVILWDSKHGGERFVFPLGKVMKYLQNGAEDSVKFFAEVIIKESTDAQPGGA